MNKVEILETPIKSEGDKKEYRLIKLKNGLKALLIKTFTDVDKTDPDENCASASLMVSIGSFHEPREIGGLAHFLEHMIFMGNRKYPEESGFNDFVTANRGRRNAMTSDEFTLYFFDSFEEAFPEALDRFANMFISPLLSKNAMQREREAVDSEYQMAISNEGARILSIFKLLIKDTHPASQFDFGNLRTLKDEISDDDLHAALLEFFKLYVANKMCVCVQSKRSLDEIQALVIEKFSDIPSDSDVPYVMPTTEFNFDKLIKPQFYEKIFYVKPKIAKKGIVITWVLPQQITNNQCKPLNHISKIFENSGEGGIASWLKEQNLTINFNMHSESEGIGFNHNFSIARLVMELTDHGMENIEMILKAIFSYLLMLKETPVEEHRRIFEAEQKSAEISFKYHQESSPITNVRNYGTNFLYNDDIDLLRTSLTPQFSEHAITEVINHMNELRFNLLFLSEKYENYTKKESYFDTEYDELDFPEAYKKLWYNRKLNEAFFLPKPNPFEANNYEIKVNEEESPKYPVKILDNESFEVWHKLDNKFLLPKVDIEIELFAPKHLNSAYNYLLFTIFKNMFRFHVRKKFSQAFEAQLSGYLSLGRTGARLSFSGYSDKIELFIELFLKEIKNVNEIVNESTFELFKNEQKEDFISSLKNIRNLGGEYQGKVLMNKFHLDYDMYKLIDQISHEDVARIVPKVLKHLKFKVLAMGNLTRDETLRIANLLDKNFDYQPHEETFEVRRRGYQLPLGVNVMRIKSFMKDDDNSYIKSYYQIGQKTKKNFNMGKILKRLTDPKVYDILRSKWQLGYAVGCSLETYGGVMGFSFIVMSQEHKHKFTEVHKKIIEFVSILTTAVEELTDDEFEKLKEAQIKELQNDVLSLGEESGRYWDEIVSEYYVFNKNEIYVDVTRELTKTEFQEFYRSFMSPENQRSICFQVIGINESNDQNTDSNNDELNLEFVSEKYSEHNIITDIEAFQRDLYLYPELKSID
ncbi:hypothetical protein PVAND_010104 [Polypedilum vanderplanki]|uniref:Insulin-degrading enzyme n=1 Tax=Polypedilum vanderplanki TaxID=319348 RepID=A0A9J6CER2_POLVA|nr:hypothetical protein PVAND_010104 [Polypedilum vanderplanki]